MKTKVILLETKDKPKIGKLCKNNIQYFIWTKKHNEGDVINKLVEYGNTIAFNIYLIDETAEIKDDKYRYFESSNGMIKVVTDMNVKTIGKYYKIIASTDASLGLPLLSEESIKLLIDYYNKNGKMPESVEVEQNVYKAQSADYYDAVGGIKLNSEGTVDISIPKDRMYTKDDIMNAIHKVELKHNKNYTSLWEDIKNNLT